MSLTPGANEEERRETAALTLLLNRVVLGLLQDARKTGGFGNDESALTVRAEELARQFCDDAGPVKVELRSGGLIELTVEAAGDIHAHAEVREDGVILASSTGRRGKVRTLKPEDLEPWAREEERRAKALRDAARGKPKFRGMRYLRTVAAPPQPAAAERILAAELYDDGLMVEFTYDTEPPTEAELESWFTRRPPMRVEDDVGTEYYDGGRGSWGGGPGASHSHFSFAPAVPAAARVLRITTDSGTVEIDLRR